MGGITSFIHAEGGGGGGAKLFGVVNFNTGVSAILKGMHKKFPPLKKRGKKRGGGESAESYTLF